MDNTKPTALNAKKIMKSLPKGFIGVSVPKKARIVYLQADATKIKKDKAKLAVSKLCEELGLKVNNFHVDEQSINWQLNDPEFDRQMVASARAALKPLKDFYSKYGIAYRYNDNACEIVRKIICLIDD